MDCINDQHCQRTIGSQRSPAPDSSDLSSSLRQTPPDSAIATHSEVDMDSTSPISSAGSAPSRPRRARANSLPLSSRSQAGDAPQLPAFLRDGHHSPATTTTQPSPKASKPAPMRRSVTRRQQARDARRVDADEHWLSEDEGSSQVDAYMQRQARAVERGDIGGSSQRDPPSDPDPPAVRSSSGDSTKKQEEATAASLQPTHDVIVPFFLDQDRAATSPADTWPDNSKLLRIVSQALSCPQCQQTVQHPITLACGHSPCLSCIQTAAQPVRSSPPRSPLLALRSLIAPNRAAASPPSPRSDVSSPQPTSFPSPESAAAAAEKVDDKKHASALLSVTSPLCPRPDCQVKHAQAATKSGDPYDGVAIKPDVLLVKLLAIAKSSELEQRQIFESEKPSIISPLSLARNVLDELECQVCFSLLDEPVTTRCSHTFCRRCLARSLDHSQHCPTCRATLPAFHHFVDQQPNKALKHILEEGFPAVVQLRRSQQQEEDSTPLPIFVCTLAFPSIPTFLHIFEPRYRLMMRRAWEHDKRFGMCLPGEQGGIHPYGTVLEIRKIEMLQDGRSLVETVGVERFKLGATDVLDGYTVAQSEPVVDVSAAQEEVLETEAVARLNQRIGELRQGLHVQDGHDLGPLNLAPELTIGQLVAKCHSFLNVMRSGAAPWLRQKLNDTLGPVPEDVADLSFYMAALLPVQEYEKVKLLEITSVRARLQLLVSWMDQLQGSWWYHSGCALS